VTYLLAFLVPYSAALTIALLPMARWAWKRGCCTGFAAGLEHGFHRTMTAINHAREVALEERDARDERVN
jgi:hypothetical protein